jgi:D-3-phosphoglycerate dehydrogenase / 2-oxoglutarate reductase
MRPHVLITDNDLGDSGLESAALEKALGAVVTVRQYRTEADVIAGVVETEPDALIVQWAPITAAVMDAMPQCKVISRVGIGVDMIDLEAAAQRGIEVRNVPTYCLEEVATHAFALALDLWRRIPSFDAQVRSGQWSAMTYAPHIKRLSQSTIGIVGLGRIGRNVARGFEVWGSTIIVHDPVTTSSDYTLVNLDTLVAEADIISLHAPLTDQTRHMINHHTIGLMRKKPVIVNTSRGPLIDEAALVVGLESGQVGGAALDVFATEPLPEDSALRSAPNVILTPHAAWASIEALPDLRRLSAQNIIDFFSDQ